jgi:hypothetical protein
MYKHLQSRLSIPSRLGDWAITAEGVQSYEEESLGVSATYGYLNSDALATLYIYNYGFRCIPDGVNYPDFLSHFAACKRGLKGASLGADTMHSTATSPPVAYRVAQFIGIGPAGTDSTWLMMTGRNDHFIKLRVSFSAPQLSSAMNMPSEVKDLLDLVAVEMLGCKGHGGMHIAAGTHTAYDELPRISAPGFDIEPFVPPLKWIKQIWMQFCAGESSLDAGTYSFSRDLYGIYRIPTQGFNYGLSAGRVIEITAPNVSWDLTSEEIDGVSVVSCYFEHVYKTERFVDVMGTQCRAVCIEPWANTFNLFYIWFGRRELIKSVYDHNRGEWIG